MHNDPNEISEGEYLSDLLDDGDTAYDSDDQSFLPAHVHRVNRILKSTPVIPEESITLRYSINKAAKLGETLRCAQCGRKFVKKTYQQAFHSTTCKDAWHNSQPSRISRTLLYNKK